jgi:hypothetical protein
LNSFLYFLLLGEGSSFMMQNLDWPITACSYPLSLTHGAGRPSTWWLQLWCKTVSIISFQSPLWSLIYERKNEGLVCFVCPKSSSILSLLLLADDLKDDVQMCHSILTAVFVIDLVYEPLK